MTPRIDPVGRFTEVEWIERTGSTNSDVVALVQAGDLRPRALLAEEQLAGRGRRDRTWSMPSGGGLLVSAFVPWSVSATMFAVPMALGIAAVEAVADTGRETRLKWPNDVVSADGRKVAGMLSDVVGSSANDAREQLGIVVGLGCNISWPGPEDGLPNAICLDALADPRIDRGALATGLLTGFDAELSRLETYGVRPTIDRYRERCATIGRSVRIETGPDEAIVGRAVDIDRAGRLLVEVGGSRRAVDAGDVVHLRPGPDAER